VGSGVGEGVGNEDIDGEKDKDGKNVGCGRGSIVGRDVPNPILARPHWIALLARGIYLLNNDLDRSARCTMLACYV
jgi:hypothetical protein